MERERKEAKREREGGDKEKGEREKGILYTHTPAHSLVFSCPPCSAIYAYF